MKPRHFIGWFFVIWFFSIQPVLVMGQYADTTYYLIDSLILDSLSPHDKLLLDTNLRHYHAAPNFYTKVQFVETIVERGIDPKVWSKYNLFLYRQLKHFLADSTVRPEQQNQLKTVMAGTLNNFGYLLNRSGNFSQALAYYFSALKMQEELENQEGIGYGLNNIGYCYDMQEDYDKALEYYEKSLKIQEAMQDNRRLPYTLNNIGALYRKIGNPSKALPYHKRSLKIRQMTEDELGIASSMNNVGKTMYYLGQKDSALWYYEQSLKIRERLGDMDGVTYSLVSMGKVYYEQGNLIKAKQLTERAYDIANEMGYPETIFNATEILKDLYKEQNNWLAAYEMYDLYIKMRDSIQNQQNRKAAIKQQMTYEFEKKEAIMQAEKEKQDFAYQEQVKRQKLIIWSVIIGLLLVIVFSMFLFNRFRVTQQQKKVITDQKILVDEKNKHITDSINYAQKIQEAILPGELELERAFGSTGQTPNYFVLYHPKDVVSGDFYWLHQPFDDQCVFAVADCTGHGVPGAFMSMIGSSLLNEIIVEKGVLQPNVILDQLREGIKKALGHSTETDSRKDGMDIALCVWDQAQNIVQFAGAYNPFYLIRNEEVLVFPANRQPIGIHRKEVPFDNHQIHVQPGDSLYLFSDGFLDQFGGPGNKKFTSKRFREKLLQIHHKSMPEQLKILEMTWMEWKGTQEQLDDICILGVRLA